MNENQEKNNPSEEATAEPLTKRVAKFSAFIYLGLAITVVIVATVGIFSISYDYEESLPPVSFPEINYDADFSVPEIVIPPSVDNNSSSDSPVINDESGISPDVSQPDESSKPDNRVMFYRPVSGEIIKPYSMDALVFSETMKDYRVHSGIDIAAKVGEDVVAFADGTVATISEDYFYGMTVSVAHADGAVSYYMNLDPALAENISVGATVEAGQKLGVVGTSARCENAEASHLHFELRVNDALVDAADEIPD